MLPHEVLVSGGTAPERVAGALAGVEGVHGAVAPGGSDWRRDGTSLVEAIPPATAAGDA